MNPEDIGPILAMAEREERRKWRREQEEAFSKENESWRPSPRVHRARGFAHQIMSVLSRHIPEACHDSAIRELMVTAYGHDWEIVSVPPERDAERDTALKAAEAMLMPTLSRQGLRSADMIETAKDAEVFGADAWVYCKQHVRPHSTGWCTVDVKDKIKLDATDRTAAIAECRDKGLKMVGD